MTSSKRTVAGVTLVLGAAVVAAASLAAGCGGDGGIVSIKEPGPPVGKPMVPDIAPGPPQDARISHEKGRWLIRFSTMLVNIGNGDFVLRATRTVSNWEIDQDVQYSESGAKVYRTPARLVWGGDGHNHWHVERIAIGRLAPFGADGTPPTNPRVGRADTKIGFCYYDYIRFLDDAAQKPTYPRFGCGEREDRAIGMGLSYGYMDLYAFGLPGQSIDVTDLPDGRYRLWLEVDEQKWFHETRRDNNVTWADLSLVTRPNGRRSVVDVQGGPPIHQNS